MIEHKRPEGALDSLRWYCEKCGHVLHESSFPLHDIVHQLREAIETFMASQALRTCEQCGQTMEFDD